MNKIGENQCRICLKSGGETLVAKSSLHEKFFSQILDIQGPHNVWLCVWCKVAINKAMKLIAIAKESQKIISNSDSVFDCLPSKQLYNLSYYHTHLDIPSNHTTQGSTQMYGHGNDHTSDNFISIDDLKDDNYDKKKQESKLIYGNTDDHVIDHKNDNFISIYDLKDDNYDEKKRESKIMIANTGDSDNHVMDDTNDNFISIDDLKDDNYYYDKEEQESIEMNDQTGHANDYIVDDKNDNFISFDDLKDENYDNDNYDKESAFEIQNDESIEKYDNLEKDPKVNQNMKKTKQNVKNKITHKIKTEAKTKKRLQRCKETDSSSFSFPSPASSKDTDSDNNMIQGNVRPIDINIEETNCFENIPIIKQQKINCNKNIRITKRKEINYEEFNFEVKYLTTEEQTVEIENKKGSNKYRNMKYQCDRCGIGFMTCDVYEDHKKRHEDHSGPYACQTCTLRFKSKEVLSQHTLIHRRLFTCTLCNVNVHRWSHCLVHRSKCGTLQSSKACEVCGKIFTNDISLSVHIKGVHNSEKKYACDECKKTFSSKQRLTVHKRTHTGVKEFSCPKCPQQFSTHSNLRAHKSVHETTKKHYCVECNTFYKTAKGLKRHFLESIKHTVKESLIYVCPECRKKFSTEKSLNSHLHARHLTAHVCSTCSKSFSSKANLRKHTKSIHDKYDHVILPT